MADNIEFDQELTATQLDAQRARNLLDRALGMSERNDIAGALVTCRQSLALAPHSPQGWSMLGLLSERDGDIHGAIEAYEKTLQLSPTSVYERESLQRLRQKRGSAPRPAPKFNFDELRSDQPKVTAAPVSIPAVPLQPIQPEIKVESIGLESSKTFRDTFYFRSLPVLIAAVICIGVILVAQRVAANRQADIAPVISAAPVNTETNTPTQPITPQVTPETLAPPATHAAPAATPTNTENTANAVEQTSPPVPESTGKPKTEPTAKPKVTAPGKMPVMPRPKLPAANRTAPTSAAPSNVASDNSSSDTVGGGPVDVGNSTDSKYIPITPPRFPNASRD